MSRFSSNFTAENFPTVVNVATGAIGVDYVSLANFDRVQAMIFCDKGLAAETITATATQAQAGGANAKALPLTQAYTREGSEDKYTRFTQTSGANTFQFTTPASESMGVIIEIQTPDLDVNNGYTEVAVALSGSSTRVQALVLNRTAAKYKPAGN